MEHNWTCIYKTKFINIKRFLRYTHRTNFTSTIKIKRTATHYTAAWSTTTQTSTKEHHTDNLCITLTTTIKTDDDQNGRNGVVIGSGFSSGNHVPGYILTPVVADRKYPPLNNVTSTAAKHRCLQHVSHSHFIRRRSWRVILRLGQERCGAKRLSPKTLKLRMLRIAAITNFKKYETELDVNMLTCNGIHADLLSACCISTDWRKIVTSIVTDKNTYEIYLKNSNQFYFTFNF